MPEPIPLIRPEHKAERKDVFPGSMVIVRGVLGGKAVAGLVHHVHPMDVMLEDSDGTLKPWNGTMPIVDVVMVQAKELPELEYDVELGAAFLFSRTEGEVIIGVKIPFYKDIEDQLRFSRLPGPLRDSLPRYVLASEIRG